jgi:Icc-related predicted phosphoesterase
MRIVCISDTHGFHDRLVIPEGDVLIHAGDFCGGRDDGAVKRFARWLEALPHRHKIVVAGDHDFLFESDPELARSLLPRNVVYLQDSGVVLDGVQFWGSPWQPWFWSFAFNLPRGEALRRKWDLIPTSTDVLITHGPAKGICDRMKNGTNLGCEELAISLERVRPYLHVCGHVHDGYGIQGNSINAAICSNDYDVVNKPIVADVDGTGLRSIGQ